MNDAEYAVAFELISAAGNARSNAMLAVRAGRRGDMADARDLLERANEDLLAAHRIQTELVQQEARGERVPVNVILVHAQDHLTAAMLATELVAEIVHLQDELRSVRGTSA